MPSPVGHALGGLAAGWLLAGDAAGAPPRGASLRGGTSGGTVGGPAAARPLGWRLSGLFAGLGMLADIDFLFGAHSAFTHSVGAVTLVAVLAALLARRAHGRFALACAAAYGTHVLFDWLGSDTSAPIGVMALWPFTAGYYQSRLHVFEAISRRYYLPNFWSHNLRAIARELAVIGPLLAAVAWRRRPAAPREGANVECRARAAE